MLASSLVCAGCGRPVPAEEPRPFRCPRARPGDDVDHVLRRVLDAAAWGPPERAREVFLDPEPNPFLRYRWLFHSYQVARSRGLGDSGYRALVDELDAAIARVDGRGFRETPFRRAEELGRAVGLADLWVKDETDNVSGTHKGRHLMGLMLWLRAIEELSGDSRSSEAPLAIASCGNAALAAAVVARAARRRLQVYVPEGAHASVLERVEALGAELEICPRRPDQPGDPSYLRLREELARGTLPFTVQGPDNGLIIEGGSTLAWELVSALLREGAALDRLFVQVGGGALAAACLQGLREALALGLIERLPRIHAVQTRGASPLCRAWERLTERSPKAAGSEREIGELLRYAARHRSEFMWPWEQEPSSIAASILDDETYDWLAVVEGMLLSGGFPLAVGEERLEEAHRVARERSGVEVSPTGTAGLAGCLELARSGAIVPGERVAVLFTGVER